MAADRLGAGPGLNRWALFPPDRVGCGRRAAGAGVQASAAGPSGCSRDAAIRAGNATGADDQVSGVGRAGEGAGADAGTDVGTAAAGTALPDV